MKIFLKIKFGVKKLLYWAVEFLVDLHRYKNGEKSILIVKIDRIGDFLLFSPAFTLLKKAYPDYKITACVSPAGKQILDNLKIADNIIVFNRNKFENDFLYRYKLLKQIRESGFEKAIYPAYSREPLGDYLIKISRAKKRIGSTGDTSNIGKQQKNQTDKYYTELVSQTNEVMHEIERNKEFLKNFGIQADDYQVRLNTSEDDEKFTDKTLRQIGSGKIIAIAPGAGDIKRQWSIQNFIGLSKKLLGYYENGGILILGDKEDIELSDKIQKSLGKNAVNMTGKTNFAQLFALLKRADIFLGNDSGVMHFASAVKTPTVEISCHPKNGVRNHPNSPLRFGPYNVPSVILQPEPDELCKDFCGEKTARFINKITVDEVFKAVKKLIK